MVFRFLAVFALILAFAAQPVRAQTRENRSQVHYINPSGLAQNPRYSQAVEITGGRTILISGQVAYDKDGKVVGKDEFRTQVKQVFENLRIALDAMGATFNDVVKLNSFVVDLPAHLDEYREVRGQYLANNEHPPASTTVGVASLVNRDLLLEVEAVVVLPEKKK